MNKRHISQERSNANAHFTTSVFAVAMGAVVLLLMNACSLKWQSSDTFDREMSMIETVQKQAGSVDLDSYSATEKAQLQELLKSKETNTSFWSAPK